MSGFISRMGNLTPRGSRISQAQAFEQAVKQAVESSSKNKRNSSSISTPTDNAQSQSKKCITSQFNNKFTEVLITSLNKLQDSFSQFSVTSDAKLHETASLPQIIVIGGQSSGKSSVLESLIGRINVFPTGDGIVTKLALRLQLVNIPQGQPEKVVIVNYQKTGLETDELTDKEFDRIEELAEYVKIHTDNSLIIAGKGPEDILDSEMTVKFFSPNVNTMTIVDIPGIVSNTNDEQDEDLPKKIENMVSGYAETENSIILAIQEGGVDLARSEGFKFAKMFDKEGKRTLGVITKCDLISAGAEEDLIRLVENKDSKWKMGLGYVAVVNPSGELKKNGITLEFARKNEATILKQKLGPVFKKHGGLVLSKRISKLLAKKVYDFIPGYKETINAELKKKRIEKQEFSENSGQYDEQGEPIFDRIMIDKLDNIKKELNSIVDEEANDFNTSIGDKLHQQLQCEIKKIHDDQKEEFSAFVATLVKSYRNPLVLNYGTSNKLLKKCMLECVKNYPTAAENCIISVFNEFADYVGDVVMNNISEYPNLFSTVTEYFHGILIDSRQRALDKIEEIFKEEKAYGATNKFEHFLVNKVDFGFGSVMIKEGNVKIEADTVNNHFANADPPKPVSCFSFGNNKSVSSASNPIFTFGSTPDELRRTSIKLWTDKIEFSLNGEEIDVIHKDRRLKFSFEITTDNNTPNFIKIERTDGVRFGHKIACKFNPIGDGDFKGHSDGGCKYLKIILSNSHVLDWVNAFHRSPMVTDLSMDLNAQKTDMVDMLLAQNKYLGIAENYNQVFEKLVCNRTPKIVMCEIEDVLASAGNDLTLLCLSRSKEIGADVFMAEKDESRIYRMNLFNTISMYEANLEIVDELIRDIKNVATSDCLND